MRKKLQDAMGEISDAHIAEAASVMKKNRKPIWLGTLAAVLALAILISVFIYPTTAQAYGLVAAPEYPDMSPYPDESAYLSDKRFDDLYSAWRDDMRQQRDQTTGYADNLTDYFCRSIPTFLASETADNMVCSPLNIYMALAMLAETAGGNSRQQILDLFHADSIHSLRTQAGQVWNAHYLDDGASASILANSLWLQDGLTYNKAAIQTLTDSYYASVYQGDLGSDQMNAALRSWLNQQTGGLLKEQIKSIQMDTDVVMALASTIYYRAKWTSEFSESQNTEGIFHAPNADQTVTYMNRRLSYGPYYWGEDFSAAYLGLEDDSKMWLILPDEGLAPADILESGNAIAMIFGDYNHYENKKTIKVNLSLPKFDVVSDLQLSNKLQALGITDVFSKNADFSAILPDDPSYLSTVQHAARVKIDEEGVEAAAYTVMMNTGAAAPPDDEVDFVLDRPFLFVITSHDDLPLFAGVVNTP